MNSVCIRQIVTHKGSISLVRPAVVFVDGVKLSNVQAVKVERTKAGEPFVVTMSFMPEELQIEGEFPIEEGE